MANEDDTMFDELFAIDFNGTVGELTDLVGGIEGVESFSTDNPEYQEVEGVEKVGIRYNAEMTDRTTILNELERSENVNEARNA